MAPKQTPQHQLDERERWVAQILRETAVRERAPERLRAAIERERRTARPTRRRRFTYGGALAGALAALALALALVLPAGTPGAPSVSQAASLALRGPSTAAPAPDPTSPAVKLGQNVEDVYFPNWARQFGWQAVGQRTDRIHGRTAVTVYYRRHSMRLAYTIVGAPALSEPNAAVTLLHGTELRTLRMNNRLVVTWRRANHTCVISAAGVKPAELQRLAAWSAPDVAS
jgi:hypothetical protein